MYRFKFTCLGCKNEVEIFAPAIKEVLFNIFILLKNINLIFFMKHFSLMVS